MASFDTLPLDARRYVFNLLSLQEKLICGRVCQAWRKMVQGLRVLRADFVRQQRSFLAVCCVMPMLTHLDISVTAELDYAFFRQITSLASIQCLAVTSASWLPAKIFLYIEQLSTLTSLTLHSSASNSWPLPPLRLFRQLRELSVTGLRLPQNMHAYLWLHRADFTVLEWCGVKYNHYQVDARTNHYAAIVKEFRDTERKFQTAMDSLLLILNHLLATKVIERATYERLCHNLPTLLPLAAHFLLDLNAQPPSIAFKLHRAYLLALAERAKLYHAVVGLWTQAVDAAFTVHPNSNGLQIGSFMIMPSSRLPKYKLFFDELVRCIALEQVEEMEACHEVLDELTDLFEEISAHLRQHDQLTQRQAHKEAGCILS